MVRMTRRTVLAALGGTAVAPLLTGGPAAAQDTAWWVGAGPFRHVYDPTPAGGPARYINDHTVVRAADGSWHLFGIVGDAAPPGQFPDGAREISFAHASAPDLAGPWTTLPDALTVDPSYFGEVHLWAPHVVEHAGTYHMFYAAGGDGAAVNLATSTDLTTWTRLPSGPLFRGLVARDPYVVRVGDRWVMYYCELAAWHGNHIVAYRTSTDLVHWSEPGTAFTDPATDDDSASVTESPFVVYRDGFWYLFVGPRNGYVGTDVFRSRDPLHFTVSDWAGHVPAHAAEVVADGDDWWVTGAGSFERGVYLAPLRWRSSPPPWQSPANPAVALDGAGRLHLFALDRTDHATLHCVLTASGSGTWQRFGPPSGAVPTVARQADGRLAVFALGVDGQDLTTRVQRADGSWDDWLPFGGPAGAAPAVSRNADGRLEAFALGPAGSYLSHRWQLAPGGDWSDWATFGGPAGGPPVVGVNADGRLEVLALGPAAAYLAHRWQNAPNGDWSDWDTTLGPTPAGSAPTIERDPRGLLTVFAVAPVGTGVNLRPQAAPSGGWAPWQGFAPWADASPAVAVNADGRLEAFLVPPGGAVLTHRWQDADGGWSAIEEFGTGPFAGTPSVGTDATGRIHVVALAPDGTLRERVQGVPAGGWRDWRSLDLAPVAVLPTGSPT